MKIKIAKPFQEDKDKIENIFKNFHNDGLLLGNGERNQIKLFDLKGQSINVKSFKIPNLINKIVYKYFRKSKAQRSFDNALYLLEHGIGTPQPIAYAENFSLFGLKDSFYASKHVEYDLTFRELVSNPDYPERDQILASFTKFTHLLHENGILFKDHSPGNTLIKKTEEGYDFFLVDLNRMVFKPLTFEERIKNFSRLTPKEEMVRVMSNRYAELMNRNPEEVFELMWKHTKTFQEKYHRKRRLKKKLGLKK